MESWLTYHRIFFDCDSTLTAIEGIDELARMQGKEAEIAALTQQAMEGKIALETVYARRLQILRPTRGQLREVAALYKRHLVADAEATVAALRFLGLQPCIVSGGLIEAVVALGRHLGIPSACVRAVEIEYDQLAGRWWAPYLHPGGVNLDERYLDHREGPLTKTEGKSEVVRRMARPWERTMLIGDGVSDLAARSAVDLFVGFGGVVRRERVAAEAAIYITAPSLAPVLPLAAGPRGYLRCRNTPHQEVFERGLAIIRDGGVIFNETRYRRRFARAYADVLGERTLRERP